jgi:hypothetical protein
MSLTQAIVTLDDTHYNYNVQEGYVHPGDDDSTWWSSETTSSIYLDPGTIIGIRSVESNSLLVPYIISTHPNLAELGLRVEETRAFDTDGRFYFTLTNQGLNSVVINTDDDIAIITYV